MLINYKNYPLEIREGDIILFRSRFRWNRSITYLSYLVRFFTGESRFPQGLNIIMFILVILLAFLGSFWWLLALFLLVRPADYNHSAVVTKIKEKLFIVEAKSKVICNPVEKVLDRRANVIMILRRPSVPSDLSDRVNSKIGTKYDSWTLIYQLIYRFPKVFLGKYGKWFGPIGEEAAERVVCSELCGYGYTLPKFWILTSIDFIDIEGFEVYFQELFQYK